MEIILIIFITSILIAMIISNFVAIKGFLGIKVGIGGGLVVGTVSGFITTSIYFLIHELNFFIIAIIEIFTIIFVGIFGVMLLFYRDPERMPPDENGIIVSPADGFIRYIRKFERGTIPEAIKGKSNISIKEIAKTDLIDGSGYIIGITMRILDVHVNRAPISGKVIFQRYIRGKFMSLKSAESDVLNERNTIIIDTGDFRVGVVQIASRTVRRIESYVKIGDNVRIGQRIGMIKYGSQTDLIIPHIEGLKILCKEGENVYGGISIIARYEDST